LLWFFAISLFVSSSLLFLVQPMIGKMILPRLGGTPAVWNTCMVFFQAVLLVGYAYTHSLSSWSDRRRQVVVHGLLLVFPFVALPFALGEWVPTESNPVFEVLWLLLGLVGLPFFVVATSAPLLQKWFTHTGHPAAKDPYFLYGASNLGSMLALVLYPIVVEPYFDLDTQSVLWTVGYALLLALVVMCGVLVWRSPPAVALAGPVPAENPPAPVLPVAETSTAVQTARHRKRGGAFSALPKATAASPPELDLNRMAGLRWVGLASLPLTIMLIVPFCLRTPHFQGSVLWGWVPGEVFWIALWGIYATALILLCCTKPWTWMEDTLLTFLIGQPVLLVGLFVYGFWLIADVTLPTGIVFVLSLVTFLLPLNFIFGLGLGSATPRPDDAPTALRRLRWVGLAAAPSSLMLGLTTYLTTDIASIPLFWVIPLALYLLTFILVFARWPWVWTERPHTIVLWVQPFCLLFLVLIVVGRQAIPIWLMLGLHTLVFFLTALVCHGELAKDRPAARHLTEFYLWMSVGGVAGGLFNGLIAPIYFWFGVVEYPLAGVLAILLRPQLFASPPFIPGDSEPDHPTSTGLALDFILPFAVGVLGYLVLGDLFLGYAKLAALVILLAACVTMFPRPVRAGLAVAALFVAGHVQYRAKEILIFEDRGYFGFVRVRESYVEYEHGPDVVDRLFERTLIHGGINHGSQYVAGEVIRKREGEKPERHDMDLQRLLQIRRRTITYFTKHSGVGQLFESQRWPDARLPAAHVALGGNPLAQLVNLHSEPPVAVVGLGIGTLAAHGRPLQHISFFEIDPLVTSLSVPRGYEIDPTVTGMPPLAPEDDDPYFYYIRDARQRGARVDVVVGDGRLSLKNAPDKRMYDKYYQIIVLDAFSSDAIPVHLLTEEAVKLYLDKLADGGVLVFNATNRYVDLYPVIADVGKAHGLNVMGYGDSNHENDSERFPSDWVLLQRPQDKFVRTAAHGKIEHTPFFSGGPPLHERSAIRERVADKGELSFWVQNRWTRPVTELNIRWTSESRPRAQTVNRKVNVGAWPTEVWRTRSQEPMTIQSVEVFFADGSKQEFELKFDCSPASRKQGQRVVLDLKTKKVDHQLVLDEPTVRLEDLWQKPIPTGRYLWTDTYSNVLRVLSLRGVSED
jgi:SAM-dependent methyltransferase